MKVRNFWLPEKLTNLYAKSSNDEKEADALKKYFININHTTAVAVLSKTYVCGSSITEIEGSNLAVGMDVRLINLLFVV